MQGQAIIKKTNYFNRRTILLLAAFAAVYIFWGSTYLAIKYAIETLPPFLMAGARFVFAGSILLIWARFTDDYEQPESGALAHELYCRNAAAFGRQRRRRFCRALYFVESRRAARRDRTFLDCAFKLALAERRAPESESRARHRARIFRRLAFNQRADGERDGGKFRLDAVFRHDCGYGGGIIMGDRLDLRSALARLRNRLSRLPECRCLRAVWFCCWSSLIAGEWSNFNIAEVSANSWFGLVYLIIFGSLIGFTAYSWLLKNAQPAMVATYAYVNPIIAVFLGWLIAGESFTGQMLVGAGVIVGSVVLITSHDKNENEPLTEEEIPNRRCRREIIKLCRLRLKMKKARPIQSRLLFFYQPKTSNKFPSLASANPEF